MARCPFPHQLFTRRKPKDHDGPESPARRAMFQGAAAFAGGAALIGTLSGTARAETMGPSDGWADTPAPDPAMQRVPFYGIHQAGITTPQPAASLVAAFNVLVEDQAGLADLFKLLTQRFAFLTQGGAAPTDKPEFPPPDSGIMGPEIAPNNLTATLSVGASLFDDRFGLAHLKPAALQEMKAFPNDRLDADWCHGDLLIQFCSNSPQVNLHALRDIIKNTPASLMVRWKQDGFLPQSSVQSGGWETPRNLLGFKDGTGNPDTVDGSLMDKLVWVQPSRYEPAWTAGGSYHVVRIIRMLVEQWDRTPLIEQEQIVGRQKMSGAPLGGRDEHDTPDFSNDPKGKITPLTAHIRRANPRTPGSEENVILRRGYSYSRGANKAGQLDMGLIFTCFQANLGSGFLTVQGRLNGEPFEEYIKPTGGGYFFALPGTTGPYHYLGQSLMEAAAA
ncbi:MAG TPA: iron uptake transporter deferrochelatase/peroxidase subunit [Devosia sp.]|nr:iron uptake transporter deferrochelatase/peroxidase subunit [Devosia sp.]